MTFGVLRSTASVLEAAGAQPAACGACTWSRRSVLAGAIGLALANGQAGAQPSRAAPVIDFHTHMCDRQLLQQKGGPPGPAKPDVAARLFDPAAQISDMDRYGVDINVITMSNALQGISWGNAQQDLQIHRRINDEIATKWVGRYPQRFVGACTLPMQDLSLAIPEMERCVRQLGCKVVEISSATPDGIYYGDRRLRPFWEAVHALNITAFIHPHLNASAPPLDDFALANSVGQGIEEAKVMSSMIYQGLFDHLPNLKVVVAHGGGFLPHYYGRMDRNVDNMPASARLISRKPSEYLRSFYYDSCLYSPDILAALIKIVGIERIVLGGDYPVGGVDSVGELRQLKTLSNTDIALITRQTPAGLLGI